MDQEALVEDFNRVYKELDARRGPVALLMLVTPEAAWEDVWNVVVSARGFDTMNWADAIREVVYLLKEVLGNESWRQVLRVTVLKTGDEFVRAMNWAHKTDGSRVHLYSANISGIDIPKAIVLQSKAA